MTATKTPPWVVSSLREVAAFFHVAYQTVRIDWRAKGVVPEERPEGGYDLSAIFQAWRDRERDNELKGQTGRKKAANGSELLIRKLQEQIGKLEQEKRKLLRENQLSESELLPRADTEAYLIQRVVQFRTHLMQLPNKISSRVPSSQRAAVIQEIELDVHSVLVMIRDVRLAEKTVAQLICEESDRIRGKQANGKAKNRAG